MKRTLRTLMTKAEIAVVALTLAACAAPQAKVSMWDLDNLSVGQTSIADVESHLGQPTHQTTTSSGFTTLIYDHAATQVMAGDQAASPVSSELITFIFDPSGKLKSYTRSPE